MVLAGNHRRRPARAFGDLGVVERGDDVRLVERAGLGDGRGPEAEPAVEAGAAAAARELGVARVRRSYCASSCSLNGSATAW